VVPSQKRNYRKRPFILPSALQPALRVGLLAILFPKLQRRPRFTCYASLVVRDLLAIK
jgi:hypothetical protein